MNLGDFGLSIIVDGTVLPEFSGPDADTWITARRGTAFSLLLTNLSGKRVEAVPAIDGLSVTTGQPFGPSSVGYLVRPQSQIVVPGWRLDNGHVARFEFGTAAAGYARQTGQSTRAVGGISAAFFSERAWSVDELRAEVHADVTACATYQLPGFDGPYAALQNMAKDRQDIWIRAEMADIGEAGCLLAAARLLGLLPAANGNADMTMLLAWGHRGHALVQWLLGRYYEQVPTLDRLRMAEQWYEAAGRQGMFEARGKAKIIQASVHEMQEAERRRAEAEKRAREEAARRPRKEVEPGAKFSISAGTADVPQYSRPAESGIWSSVKRWLLADAVPESKARPAARQGVPGVTDSEQYTEDVAVVFGKQIEHRVRPLQFRRASAKPDVFINIRYDTARGLTGRGIGCPIPQGWQVDQ